MHADDSVLYERCQGQPIEHGIDSVPGIDALVPQPLNALQAEAKEGIDVSCLYKQFASASLTSASLQATRFMGS